MVAKKQADGLPAGWKVEVRVKNSRKFKCYINSKTPKKFYSKLSVLRHIKGESIGNEKSSRTKGHTKKSSVQKQLAVGANDLHNWLPSGWTIESRTRKSGVRKGTKYKCFIDLATGSQFYSKPEVYRYLESMERDAGSSQQKKKGSSRHSSNNKSLDPPSPHNSCLKSNVMQLSKTRLRKSHSLGKRKVVIETATDTELPPGWIKEIRKKMIGNGVVRRDPLYIDPTGLVFRSKPDAIRYIKSGEVSRHAYRRKNRNINVEEFAVVKTSPPASVEREKATKIPTRKQLFADEVSPKQLISALPKVSGTRETASKRVTRSSSKVGLALVHEASVEHNTLLQPADTIHDMIPEKASAEKVAATEATEGMIEVTLPMVQDVGGKKGDATHWKSKPFTAPSRDTLTEEKPKTVAMKGCSNEKAQTSKRKTKDRKIPNLPSRSSKRLAGEDAQVVFHAIPIEHALRSTHKKSRNTQLNPNLGSTPSESQQKPQSPYFSAQNGLASEDGRFQPLNIDTQTVLAVLEDSSKQFFQPEIDLQERYPPGFSQNARNARTEASPTKTDQSVDPTDEPMGSKIEKSPGERQLAKEHPDEPPESKIENSPVVQVEQSALAERDMGQPESQFCFPSPLWSDPCLEFAYKTLTGAIPLDDNLAIEDYLQYQLRTSSEQSNKNRSLPDMGMPSFQNDETKPISSFPGDISIPNSNGFGSERPSR